MNFFPIEDLVELLDDAEEQWYKCSPEDWKEAFSHHPKIGDIDSLKKKFASTANWAIGEQGRASTASEETIKSLAKGNKEYEDKFGYIFIVCATGKSADEMLTILESRLPNDPEKEIEIAADEQNKITRLRLEKLLDE
jgi:2-oxo-4-hydroxy-4-carboxy-5-ureidoimidazoline decarboxylase